MHLKSGDPTTTVRASVLFANILEHVIPELLFSLVSGHQLIRISGGLVLDKRAKQKSASVVDHLGDALELCPLQ
jgi:hypothetical protein